MATINLATKYSTQLAKKFTAGSFVAGNASRRYEFDGVKSIVVATPITTDLVDYDRTKVDGSRFGALTSGVASGKIVRTLADGGLDVRTVGHIDISKYSCIAKDITTDEVVITPERVQHIKERRGDGFLEKYEQYFSDVVYDPDYIFADERPNTAIVCKTIGDGRESLNLVLRIVVKSDNPEYKNSILTAIRENEKRFAQRLRNNVPVYEKG